MKRQNYILYLLLVFILANGIAFQTQAQTKTAAQVQAVKTNAHLNIPGTRIFMLQPEGYEFSHALGGFMKGSQFFVKAMEMEMPYSILAKDFNKKKMEEAGQKVHSIKKMMVSGLTGTYMVSESEGLVMNALAFGNEEKSAMLVGATESKNPAQGKAVEAAILSAVYDEKMEIDLKATAAFTLDESGSAFKYATKTMFGYLYSKDGSDPTFETGVAYIEIVQYPAEENTSLEELVKTSAAPSEFSDLPDGEIKNAGPLTLNGLKAYQVEVHGTGDQKGQVHYYCGISNGKTTIIFKGKAPVDVAANLKEFKRLTTTIKLK